MTDFSSYKSWHPDDWTKNTEIEASPKASNIWIDYNSLVDNFSNNFDTIVRSLFSVEGENFSYDLSTGRFTYVQPNFVISLTINESGDLQATFNDSTIVSLGGVGGTSVNVDHVSQTGDNPTTIEVTFWRDSDETTNLGSINIPKGTDGINGLDGEGLTPGNFLIYSDVYS